METRIISEDVFEMKKVKTGQKDKSIYITNDGKEWTNESDAKKHEKSLEVIEKCKNDFEEINPGDFYEYVIKIVFLTYGEIEPIIFLKWKVPPYSEDKLSDTADYLKEKGCKNIVYGDVFYDPITRKLFEDNAEVLIVSWARDADRDYPSYYTRAILFTDAVKSIDDIFAGVRATLTEI